MKMRWMMALIAGLAVLTWLAIPAVRIWRDSSLLDHMHFSQITEVKGKTVATDSSTVTLTSTLHSSTVEHPVSFGRRYTAMLLGRPWSDPDACGMRQFFDEMLKTTAISPPGIPPNAIASPASSTSVLPGERTSN